MWAIMEKTGALEGFLSSGSTANTGTLTNAGVAAFGRAPNFVIVHPNGKFLYAVTMAKLADYKGTVEGFAIDAKTGKLTAINRQPCGGDNPCHLAIDPSGKMLIVANYSGGSIAAFALAANGELSPATAVIKHEGSSVNPKRQDKPYAHGITFDATGKVILTCDLGADKLFNYQVDAEKGGRLRDVLARRFRCGSLRVRGRGMR